MILTATSTDISHHMTTPFPRSHDLWQHGYCWCGKQQGRTGHIWGGRKCCPRGEVTMMRAIYQERWDVPNMRHTQEREKNTKTQVTTVSSARGKSIYPEFCDGKWLVCYNSTLISSASLQQFINPKKTQTRTMNIPLLMVQVPKKVCTNCQDIKNVT